MSNDINVNEETPAAPWAEGGGRPDPTVTLALDTATERRSVAVLRGEETLAELIRERGGAGVSTVLQDIDEVLREAAVSLEEVDLFAAAAGPGSFTGLRAGLATVKALAKALGRGAVGVPTLHALAYPILPYERCLAFFPAGRGEYFAQTLEGTPAGTVVEHGPPIHVRPEILLREAPACDGALKWVTAGGESFAERVRSAAHAAGLSFRRSEAGGGRAGRDEWLFVESRRGLAASVGLLSRRASTSTPSDAYGPPRALYVRASDAELKG